MLDSRRRYVGLRYVALLPLALFVPVVLALLIDPSVVWGEYLGVFFHLSILLLVSRPDAAPWAKAVGYGWVVLDVLAGILVINDIPYETVWAVRLGGRVLAGVWIVASSLASRSWLVRIAGLVSGVWLAGYSFVGTTCPRSSSVPREWSPRCGSPCSASTGGSPRNCLPPTLFRHKRDISTPPAPHRTQRCLTSRPRHQPPGSLQLAPPFRQRLRSPRAILVIAKRETGMMLKMLKTMRVSKMAGVLHAMPVVSTTVSVSVKPTKAKIELMPNIM